MRARLAITLLPCLILAGCSQAPSDYAAYEAANGAVTPTGDRYDGQPVSPVHQVASEPISTFAVDVDTGAYAHVRHMLLAGQAVPADAVRTEEMVNYFRYDYPLPDDRTAPFSVTTDVATTPWNPGTRLLRIGLRGYDVTRSQRPPANLVFMVDVSGSMQDQDKLPLVKQALSTLADGLRPDDSVSIITYAGGVETLVEGSHDPAEIRAALDGLDADGATAGGPALAMAYDLARAHRIPGGINRIFMATDGDFNVGLSDQKGLEDMVKQNREDGITLTTLGFGQGNYNDAMMEAVADLGNGNHAYIDSAMEARKVLDEELSSTLFTIAKDVKVQVEFNPAAVSQYRLIGYENRALAEADFADDKVDAGEIGAGHQVTALYEIVPVGEAGWTGERRYAANRPSVAEGDAQEMATVRLRYTLPEGQSSRLIERPVPTALIAAAGRPQGDMAFAIAVAAFGQKLRGDTKLGDFTFGDIARLAGPQADYWRQEFVQIARLADHGDARE
ncbi:VWA domain-containing protein [Sphingobium sp. HBC34]|uniref:VWA domain-containing protein n=1 Tax=Sphingobium cyanobacteriorum TaxID=3063954 RepID=A0ABT8ZQJ0_9SPHN|nr:VWA domain-containing protein [Sphingobium sp. HBC34]MDO7836807.1 VWA domain-containing protein [Sphingobium sp. HBC34]